MARPCQIRLERMFPQVARAAPPSRRGSTARVASPADGGARQRRKGSARWAVRRAMARREDVTEGAAAPNTAGGLRHARSQDAGAASDVSPPQAAMSDLLTGDSPDAPRAVSHKPAVMLGAAPSGRSMQRVFSQVKRDVPRGAAPEVPRRSHDGAGAARRAGPKAANVETPPRTTFISACASPSQPCRDSAPPAPRRAQHTAHDSETKPSPEHHSTPRNPPQPPLIRRIFASGPTNPPCTLTKWRPP